MNDGNIDHKTIYTSKEGLIPDSSDHSKDAPIPTPPEEQTITLLKEASTGQHVDHSGVADKEAPPPKTLIVYAYAESPNARENLEYFIAKGIHGMADFLFIFNGETDAYQLLPNKTNIKFVQRENKCYDLGTMGEVLAKDSLWKGYKRFITLNASIRGPFLPTYSSSSCWSDIFLSRLTDKVKVCCFPVFGSLSCCSIVEARQVSRGLVLLRGQLLTDKTTPQLVGTTMNCQPYPHVQSMLLATDSTGMSILLSPTLSTSVHHSDFFGSSTDPTGFTPCYTTMHQAIHGELGLTELIRSQGYEVDVLLTAAQSHGASTYCEKVGNPEDILYEGKYFGSNVHPYELVFIKANRNIDPTLLEAMTRWHLAQNGSAWDTCGDLLGRKIT